MDQVKIQNEIKELKVRAYDLSVFIQNANNELQAVNQRVNELLRMGGPIAVEPPASPKEEEPKKKEKKSHAKG